MALSQVDNLANAIGVNSADNLYDSSSVAANADGSLLERSQYIQEAVADVQTEADKIGTPAGADVSTDIAAVKTEVDKIGTPAGADVSTDIAAVQTEVDKIGTPAGADVSTDIAAIQTRVDEVGVKTTTIADGTTIPNNTQSAAGLLATASGGAVMIEEIVVQRGADNFVGPTNYEFTSDNAAGATGAAAPHVVMLLAKFNAATTSVASLDGATKQLPFVLETGKKLYIHGDDAATSAGGTTDFYIKYKPCAAGATLA